MADSLSQRIQDLPVELFNQILSEVVDEGLPKLEADGFRYQHVTAAYKYPVQLQINRAIRNEFAKQYFGKTVFVVKAWGVLRKLWGLLRKFLLSTEREHLALTAGFCIPSVSGSELPRGWVTEFFDEQRQQGVVFHHWSITGKTLPAIGERLGYKARVEAIVNDSVYRRWFERVNKQKGYTIAGAPTWD